MKIVYGGYSCQEASTSVEIRKSTQQGQTGHVTITRVAWVLRGFVRASTGPTALTPLLRAHETAFSQHGQDIRLQHDGTDTAHVLLNSDTLSGTRVSQFSWLRRDGAEYVNRRAWMAVITAEILARNSGLVSWNESVRVVGTGGPVIIWQPVLFGPPVPQQTQSQSSILAFQRGSAVGISGYPDLPLPLFNVGLIKSRPTWNEAGSPLQLGQRPFGYRTNWLYVYEGLGFAGQPVLP